MAIIDLTGIYNKHIKPGDRVVVDDLGRKFKGILMRCEGKHALVVDKNRIPLRVHIKNLRTLGEINNG